MLSLLVSLGYYMFIIISGLLFLVLTPPTLVYAGAYKMLLMMTICSCIILFLLFVYFIVTNDTFRKDAFTRITRKGNKIFSMAPVFCFFVLAPVLIYMFYIKMIPSVITAFPINIGYQTVVIKDLSQDRSLDWCIKPEEFTQFMNNSICDIPSEVASKLSLNDRIILVGRKTDLSFGYYAMVVTKPELDTPIKHYF
ncbi:MULTISPECIES: hypothetical protein [unclassified Photobacterium]|uniref:hypothetical protein n=1 Tax=unclassified Photobacterium TaxID=2628852 RepID=UPI001EDDC0EF|nr:MULTISPECIES: hypothetical protein [unclassified Photobacterium]MCG3865823.1 hypothetical protein [Photobacterium sp. Ph6]MCG3877298.1 hypothetical protein [Photobacterium sp. Ph5]